MPFLLDANAIIALMANVPAITTRVTKHAPDDILLSSIVLHELLYGAFASDRIDRNLAQLDEIRIKTLPFDETDARSAGRIRANLRRAGTPIGPYDVLIAGQALARDFTVVTANVREFARVEGLRIEDWSAD